MKESTKMKKVLFPIAVLALSVLAFGQSIDDPDPMRTPPKAPKTSSAKPSTAKLAGTSAQFEVVLVRNGWDDTFNTDVVVAMHVDAFVRAGFPIGPNTKELIEEAARRDELISAAGKWIKPGSERLEPESLEVSSYTIEVTTGGNHDSGSASVYVNSYGGDVANRSVTATATWTIKDAQRKVLAVLTPKGTCKTTELQRLSFPVKIGGSSANIDYDKYRNNPQAHCVFTAVERMFEDGMKKVRKFLAEQGT
ncbi:MAG: hypothetical protein Q7K33_01290 [Candidatus Berkelbacteria bacterium]|nr:hypothetical protein [Candidatus Berkelbacteria bacterium]